MRILAKFVPRPLKRAVRRRLDARLKARLFGALAPMVPDVEDMYDGPAGLEEFKANGEEFLRIYVDVCGLHRDERMLDVGSGIGRKTIPLTRYLSERATYVGIDVNRRGVEWCRERISARHPNFTFQQIDVYNELYNPGGTTQPAAYRFPFDDASFTFVMLGSVFTHMLPDDVEHYLGEVARVLEPGGRCLISYFLLDGETRAPEFVRIDPRYATTSPDMPETAIAYDEAFILSIYARLGLKIVRLERGSWCGRQSFLSYQDLVLAKKEV